MEVMMSPKDFFEAIRTDFTTLPGHISATTTGEFEKQFISMLDAEEAKNKQGIVYLWLTEKPIPRVRGKSRILYIGKTINTLRIRQRRYAKTETSGGNWIRLPHIIEHYGPVTFWIASYNSFGNSPKDAEKSLLTKYFETHLEIPPFNRMSI